MFIQLLAAEEQKQPRQQRVLVKVMREGPATTSNTTTELYKPDDLIGNTIRVLTEQQQHLGDCGSEHCKGANLCTMRAAKHILYVISVIINIYYYYYYKYNFNLFVVQDWIDVKLWQNQ